jgi:protein-tyrosine kinase
VKPKPAIESIAAVPQPVHQASRRVKQLLPIPGIDYRKTRVVAADARIWRRGKIVVDDLDSESATTFRMLRTSVLQRLVVRGYSSLAITSPRAGGGTTLVAANLAVGLAIATSHTVLLVDLNLRRPALHRLFGIECRPGLTDHIFDGVDLSDCLVNPGLDRLVILPAGGRVRSSSEILLSRRGAELAHELKTRYPDRLVVYDVPSVLGSDDAQAFLPLVDSYLMVVKSGETRQADVRRSVEILGGKLLGTVINS